jgi:hypothetical protein
MATPIRPSRAIRFNVLARRLFLAAVVAFAPTAALPATPPSHLGQNIADHVMLDMNVVDRPCELRVDRTFPSGLTTYDFTVPSGKTLVITDIYWRAHRHFIEGYPPLHMGRNLTLRLYSHDGNSFFESDLLVTDENVLGLAKSEHPTAGIAVNAVPCMTFWQLGEPGVPPVFGDVQVYGYLIPSPTR